jgi:hypothetical protein
MPFLSNSSLRWAWSQPADVVDSSAPSDAINHFFHTAHLTDGYRGGSPNNYRLFSDLGLRRTSRFFRFRDRRSEKLRYYSFESPASTRITCLRRYHRQRRGHAIVPPGG